VSMSLESNPTTQRVLHGDASRRANLMALMRREWVWLVLAAMVVLLAALSSNFLTTSNLLNILRQVSIVGIVAVGVAVVLMAGNFDLSVGAILTLAAVVSVQMQPIDPVRPLLSIVAPLTLGTAVGVANGAIIGLLRANSGER
jgi:ribose/xylose/arabinose/galactoside ABC-type transport system permease subunit